MQLSWRPTVPAAAAHCGWPCNVRHLAAARVQAAGWGPTPASLHWARMLPVDWLCLITPACLPATRHAQHGTNSLRSGVARVCVPNAPILSTRPHSTPPVSHPPSPSSSSSPFSPPSSSTLPLPLPIPFVLSPHSCLASPHLELQTSHPSTESVLWKAKLPHTPDGMSSPAQHHTSRGPTAWVACLATYSSLGCFLSFSSCLLSTPANTCWKFMPCALYSRCQRT